MNAATSCRAARLCALVLAAGALANGSSGCRGGDGFGVGVELRADALDDTTLARITQINMDASGDETFSVVISLARTPLRDERVVYRPRPQTRNLTLAVKAVDATGEVLATGTSGSLLLLPNELTTAVVELSPIAAADLGVDALPLDGAVDGPTPSRCVGPDADAGIVACAGFESTSDTLLLLQNNGEQIIDTTRAFRGASSLRMTVHPVASQTSFTEVRQGPLASAPMNALRAYYYFTSYPPDEARFLNFQQSSSPYRNANAFIGKDGALGLQRNVSGTSTLSVSTTKIPLGRWFCLELRIGWNAGASGTQQLYLDDAEVADISYTGPTLASPPQSTAMFGPFFSALPTDFTFWADEVIVGTVPLGCAR